MVLVARVVPVRAAAVVVVVALVARAAVVAVLAAPELRLAAARPNLA
jgi:hypothetical protein